MPITQGAGNPNWNRDETLLALDLLYRHGTPIPKGHDDVLELSRILKSAIIHPADKQRPSFRNSDGVAMKLQNLLSAIEPTRGLSSSALDRELVLEFPESRAVELASICRLIRLAIAHGGVAESVPDDEMFPEGQLLTQQHRRRDRRLRTKLLSKKAKHQLVCDICGFVPPSIKRPLCESFFEAHHIRPLSEIEGTTMTRLSDMSLLCAGCHRFIHKLIAMNKRWFSIAEARKILMSSATLNSVAC